MARKSLEARNLEREAVAAIILAAESALQHHQIRDSYLATTGTAIAYTTLRKRLDELLDSGQIRRSTERRNPRYSSPSNPSPDSRSPEPTGVAPSRGAGDPHRGSPTDSPGFRLSDTADRVRSRILLPRAQRQPVTYNEAFLDAYRPGETWYLPMSLRDQLRDLGRTAYADQPAGTYARDIMQRLIIDLSWGSSRLEGNKYTRNDTEELLTDGREADGASPRDRQMILNHKAAIEFLVENAQAVDFNRYTILGLHALLAENLLGNADDEGALRLRPIVIGESVYTPTSIPQIIEQEFDRVLHKAIAIPDPLEQAFFIMVHLPYLQPFIDVNKRTSRLAANIPLIKANLCPLSFVDVPEKTYTEGTLAVYELNDVALLRDVFAWAYERSCAQFQVLRHAMGEPDPTRLRYRAEIRSVIAEIVRDIIWPTDKDLLAHGVRLGVLQRDQIAFSTAVRTELRSLRPDILARYNLRKSEFEAWLALAGDIRKRAH